jgi:hypothetical protein
MAGYGARQGVSVGTLDQLYAKILVLEGKDRSVALVTMDLIGIFPDHQTDQLRSRVKKAVGIDDVILSCSHTHSGPNMETENPLEWQVKAVDDIGAAIERAWSGRAPARMGVGQGSVFIAHNRLYYMSNGGGKMLWRNETKIRTSPVDPTAMVLRLDRMDGTPLALVVNYACHPVVLGPENLRYSADYPGEMMRIVESSVPGNPMCMFVQGASGDINPYYDKTPIDQNAVGLMKETGRTMAKEVLKVAKTIQTKPAPDSEIKSTREVLKFKSRWNKEKLLALLADYPIPESYRKTLERRLVASFEVPLTVLLINQDFAYVGIPAEIFVDYQIDLRERIKDFPVIFGGYTNGNFAYIPTIKGAVDGGYGASQMGAMLEVGAGDRLIDRAVIILGYWTGRLKSKPPISR